MQSGGSTAADDRNEACHECLVAEGVADLRLDTEPGKELGDPARIDEHVVVGFVVATPEIAFTDEDRHLAPEDPIIDDRAASGEEPVISEPDPRWLFAAGDSPREVTDVEREHPGGLERTRHRGQGTIDVFLAV